VKEPEARRLRGMQTTAWAILLVQTGARAPAPCSHGGAGTMSQMAAWDADDGAGESPALSYSCLFSLATRGRLVHRCTQASSSATKRTLTERGTLTVPKWRGCFLHNTKLGMCPCDATEHKLRPSNGLRALATGDVSTIVTPKSVIKHRYRTI
jgi:hypothetical protein